MNASIGSLITQYASAAGVPPEVALAVATQESGGNQFNSNGSLVTGTSGEIGVFQLMPATAAQLGVNPADVNQNIQGGISYLQQLYAQFGDWNSAIMAYNAGPGSVASGNIPASTQGYLQSVLNLIGKFTGSPTVSTIDMSLPSSIGLSGAGGSAVPITALAIGLFGLLVLWWIVD